MLVVNRGVWFLLEHGRVDLLLLVSKKGCLDLVDSWVCPEFELSSSEVKFTHFDLMAAQREHSRAVFLHRQSRHPCLSLQLGSLHRQKH